MDNMDKTSQFVREELAFQALITEYNGLREEILFRLRHQWLFITITLAAIGTILSLVIQTEQLLLLTVIPLISLGCLSVWCEHAANMAKLVSYILDLTQRATAITGDPLSLGWEVFLRTRMPSVRWPKFSTIWKNGLFIGAPSIVFLVLLVAAILEGFRISGLHQLVSALALAVSLGSSAWAYYLMLRLHRLQTDHREANRAVLEALERAVLQGAENTRGNLPPNKPLNSDHKT